MRVWILMGAAMVCTAIDSSIEYGTVTSIMFVVLFVGGFIMDIYEWIERVKP